MKTSAIQTAAALIILGFPAHTAPQAQGSGVELLLPGTEYDQREVPPDAAGTWWVLHRPVEQPVLERMDVIVTPFRTCGDEDPNELSGRAVSTPDARAPILLVRGLRGLTAGPVRTAFAAGAGRGEAARVEVGWDDQPVIVRHVADDPEGDQAGRYRIELTIGSRHFQLRSDQWHGDGHWRVRWIGDLNRDGWPDLLLDASYKYSVYTTRLYLSRVADGRLDIAEVASLEHTAC